MITADVIRYVLNNYPYPNELSKARLNKIIYLIDWKSSIELNKQVTPIQWLFNHYGPYVKDIEALVAFDGRFEIENTTNVYGNEKNIVKLKQDENFEEPDESTKQIIDFIIDKTRKFNWKTFIDLVYSTYPILTQEKGSELDLITLAQEYKLLKASSV